MRELKSDPCNTVNVGCKAPPAFEWSFTRAKCFRCGEHVCKNCSKVQSYMKYGRRRICGRCQEEMTK